MHSRVVAFALTAVSVLMQSHSAAAQESSIPQSAQRGTFTSTAQKERGVVKAVPVTILDYTGRTKSPVPRGEPTTNYTAEPDGISSGAHGSEIGTSASSILTSGKQPPSIPLVVESPQTLILSSSFETIDFDGDAANGGFYHIPPDPIGAATGVTKNSNLSHKQWREK